ncbi:flagellar hook-basal body complex protein FliE [bacterium]|nr:flagellar hook-basal body complex protein FliE [bacterium]
MSSLNAITAARPLSIVPPAMALQESAPATSFSELLSASWEQTQALNAQATNSIENSLIGEDLSMVESFTAVREADIALRMMMQIRNKLVDAYQELQQLRF